MLYNMKQKCVIVYNAKVIVLQCCQIKVHIVTNITTMKLFPACRILPAARAASAAAAALMHACHPSLKPSRDLIFAVD